ncbi:hypothetical protein J2S09_000539 [Bacillus fengqiuensis]|nr:hypothetical protein [Bacillus fengqiuensis]
MIDNRIVNGGFETGVLSPFSGKGVTIDSANSHSGSFSARLAGGTSTNFLSQLVPVSPGENFEFRVSLAKIGTNNSPPISMVISYLDSGSNVLGTALTANIPSSRLPSTNEDNWLEIYMITSLAPPTTTHAQVVITKIAQSGSASVVVDDMALLTVTGGPPGPGGDLIVNGDLQVNGHGTVQGDLRVNGNTILGNGIDDSVKVVGHFETLSNTSFLGTNNIFNRSVFVHEHLEVVPESPVIGSGSLRAGTLELAGFLGGEIVPNEALIVRHGHIAMWGAGQGIILTAPNNTLWLLTVDNSGNLTTTPVS